LTGLKPVNRLYFNKMDRTKIFYKPVIISFLMIFSFGEILATHNRAGEITYKQLGPFTYEITLITYTYTKAPADRPEIDIEFGDGTQATVKRIEQVYLPDDYKRNKYVVTHTYPGAGTYVILMQDPNRNAGVLNIPNSVNIMFAVKTVLQINPNLGRNNTPVMLNPPIDKAAKGKIFVHNPNAFDPDGDSLSYKLTVCLGDDGQPISSYTFPAARIELKVDPITGDLIWNFPETLGIYNVAMEIEEWRNGVKIGKIIRDMQIEVIETDNQPPVIDPLKDWCVTADSLIQFTVTASDNPKERVTVSSTGGVYLFGESPATFSTKTNLQTVSSDFRWQTNCSHVRRQPYLVIFKATDDNPEQILAAYRNVNISIVAPPVDNVRLEPMNNSIWVRWDPTRCSNASGYKIYRKNRRTNFKPAECELGVPESLDYKLIATLEGASLFEYHDLNDGEGLIPGYEYCYLIISYFEDGAESYASEEACTDLTSGIPVIVKTSVSTTDAVNGAIHLDWVKPFDFDTVANPGPYRYYIFRSDDLFGNAFTDPVIVDGIDNTFLVDTNYNTLQKPRIYKMGLFNYNAAGNVWNIIGVPSKAASPFLVAKPGDNKVELDLGLNVPWENYEYQIFRKKQTDTEFSLLTTTDSPKYVDKGLTNGITYCYQIKTIGQYGLDFMPKPIINFSQIACTTPLDTFPPCPPELTVFNNCDSARNELTWTNPNTFCADDVIKYHIYYTKDPNGAFELIATINNPNTTRFIHLPENTLAGCYIVTAIDSFDNESAKSNRVCADNCEYYRLPNVFSPDGDGVNDIFKPLPYQLVEKIDIKIYSRWGGLVFQTNNPDINWDGKNMITKQTVPPGVYYYICDVWEYRLSGLEIRNLTGFIHIFIGGSGSSGN
jgi:gliding motility-associated-like protein